MAEQTEKKLGVKDYLDRVISSEGIQTDIRVDIPGETLLKASIYFAVAGLAVVLVSQMTKGIIKNLQN